MKRNSYDETVKKIGETMGRNFANDFIFELLRKKNKIPKNFEVFANLWAGFDSKAGFGDIFIDEFSEEKKQIAITIVDSFLVRKTGDDHRSCGFMVGYIKGILDEGFKEYYRWALEIDYLKIPGRVFEVSRVDHSGTGQLCKFDVQLKEEELTETFDIYSKCKKAYYEGRFDDVIFLARVTIEICLRERIGLPRDSRVSTFKILGILKKKKVATVDFEEIKSLYSSLSKVIHSSKKSDKQYCSNVIDILSNIVHSVNRIDLSVSEWNEIRKEALGDRDYSLDQ
ncbi:MAG: hypothetical protein HXS54_05780 [Theionarchaea archaeon]|nr:hypothetical protein [Theionarchaea archaeon]